MKLNYNLARRLKRYKEEKREIEAIEKELSLFFSKSQEEQREEVEQIEERILEKLPANREYSPNSISDKERKNKIQRRYRAKKKAQMPIEDRDRKPIEARNPVMVFQLRVK